METCRNNGLGGNQMHILALLGVIIGGIGVWYWRYKAMRDVGNEVIDAVGRARGAYRMHNFKKKAESSVLASVDDPALAAAIFLFALANENAAGAHLAEAEIRRQLAPILPADKAEEMLAYAAWAARSVVDSRDCIRRFKPLWRDSLTLVEREDLTGMARAIVNLTPKPEHSQRLAIEALDTALIV
jgi:hypothetical protein